MQGPVHRSRRLRPKLLDTQPGASRHRPERLLAVRLWRGRQTGIADWIRGRAEAQRVVEGAWQGHRSLGRLEYKPLPGGGRIRFRFGDGAPPGRCFGEIAHAGPRRGGRRGKVRAVSSTHAPPRTRTVPWQSSTTERRAKGREPGTPAAPRPCAIRLNRIKVDRC